MPVKIVTMDEAKKYSNGSPVSVDPKTGKISVTESLTSHSLKEEDLHNALLGKNEAVLAGVTVDSGGTTGSVYQADTAVVSSVHSKQIPSLNKEVNEKPVPVIGTKPLCNVGVQARQTINMGNYNSVTVGVSVNIPCEQSELNDMYDFAKLWVDTKMGDLQKEVLESKKE